MAEKISTSKKGFSADWLMRGVLTKIGDSFDKLTGRKWMPSSSLAASQLVERIKKLLDAEAKEVPGKGKVVPHNIKLKIQWNKFSDDAEDALKSLQIELLTAAVDHINDSLYYTYSPIALEVKPDYFIEGVKLTASFDGFEEDEGGVEMNVTLPAINVSDAVGKIDSTAAGDTYIFRFEITGEKKEKRLEFVRGQPQSVGRVGANALIIDDTSVSKTHASLAVGQDGSLAVADTGSTNGTFINDERIAYGKAVRLVDGDKIKFGTVEVTFEHVPRPVLIEEHATKEADVEETISIDGFEFKKRAPPEPVTEEGDAASQHESETSPKISMPQTPIEEASPDDTLKMGSDRRPEAVQPDETKG